MEVYRKEPAEVPDNIAESKVNRTLKLFHLESIEFTEMGATFNFTNDTSLYIEGSMEGMGEQPFLKYFYTEPIRV